MRLLIAEDNDRLRKSLVHIFEKNNYSVDSVRDGADALSYALTGEYDAYIFDIMMPSMDGISLLKTIRQNGVSTPALFLTARTEVPQKVEGLDAGADDYLVKPFSIDELLARVRAILRRREHFTPDVIRFEDLVFNRATYELYRVPGKASRSILPSYAPESNNSLSGNATSNCSKELSVSLSRKEFQIMEMLMINPRSLVTSDQIMDRIWGGSDTDVSSMWVHMSNLRKKLFRLGSRVEIRYIRNAGYILSAKKSNYD